MENSGIIIKSHVNAACVGLYRNDEVDPLLDETMSSSCSTISQRYQFHQ